MALFCVCIGVIGIFINLLQQKIAIETKHERGISYIFDRESGSAPKRGADNAALYAIVEKVDEEGEGEEGGSSSAAAFNGGSSRKWSAPMQQQQQEEEQIRVPAAAAAAVASFEIEAVVGGEDNVKFNV